MSKNQKSKLNKRSNRGKNPSKADGLMLTVPDRNGKSVKIVSNNQQNGKKDTNKRTKLSKNKIIAIVVAAILLLALAIGGIVFAINNASRQDDTTSGTEPEPEAPKEPEPLENKDPLAPEPGEIDPATYKVAAYKPRFISLPSLGLNNIPVTEVGWVDGKNQLASPVSTRVAGWFYRSAIPGEKGPAIINAHGGDLGTGIFKTLPKIKNGDEIIIEMGDGRKFSYYVGEIVFAKLGAEANDYMNTAFKSLVPGKPSLTLITCTGTWLPDLQTYDQRLFVRAATK